MLHAFETIGALGQTILITGCALMIFTLCTLLHQWSWNKGYKAGKLSVQGERRQRQTLDTQINVYGRLKNALEAFQKRDDQQRGIQIVTLGNTFQKDIYTINIFWKNEYHSLGILGIQVYPNSIHIESMSAPCPQGTKRDYATTDLGGGSIEGVIPKFTPQSGQS